jgi:RNA polymerase sigma-70 factor (ECF subfamily)
MLRVDETIHADEVAPPVGLSLSDSGEGKTRRVPTKTSNGKPFSEQTLWMLAIRDQRDKRAFAQLFDHFAPRLKGFVIRSGAAPGQAEDIVQDVMLSVWRKAHLFDPERAQVSSWIYQIARNRQIDIARKNGRPLPEALKAEETETEPDAGQVLALEQETDVLREALNRLNPDQREMIEKAYLGELSHSDIAETTGLPLGTIKSRIRLGLERLRHELKDLRQE